MDAPVLKALQEAGVTKEQLGSVEIVGGSTRQAPDDDLPWPFFFFSFVLTRLCFLHLIVYSSPSSITLEYLTGSMEFTPGSRSIFLKLE